MFDTDICIYLLNQKPGHESILKRLDGREHGEIVLSAITLAELRYGIAASRLRNLNLAKLELFLASFEVVPFGDRAAFAYGPLRVHLQAQGTPIGPARRIDCRPCTFTGRDSRNQQRPRVFPCAPSGGGELASIMTLPTGPHRIRNSPQTCHKNGAVGHKRLWRGLSHGSCGRKSK